MNKKEILKMIGGILLGGAGLILILSCLFYWFENDSLTQIQVMKHTWGRMVGGIVLCAISKLFFID